MDKKDIEARLDSLKKLKLNHEQDILELGYVIAGLEKQLADIPNN